TRSKRDWSSDVCSSDLVRAALELGASLSAGSARVAIVDRWQPDGTHGPRMARGVPFGEALRLRLGRGSAPGRIGAALEVRTGNIEASWGRLDYAFGGTITGIRLGLASGKRGGPAEKAGPRES